MIRTTFNRGFQLSFENGLTISVQIGSTNYCERRGGEFGEEQTMDVVSSRTAEIAIWDKNDNWFLFGDGVSGDMVNGYISADDIAEWIYKTSKALDLTNLNSLISGPGVDSGL